MPFLCAQEQVDLQLPICCWIGRDMQHVEMPSMSKAFVAQHIHTLFAMSPFVLTAVGL